MNQYKIAFHPSLIITLLSLASLSLLNSCQDVIDVDIDAAPQLLVVDGWLNNKPEPQTIKLTLSQPYFDNAFASGVNGAVVSISSSEGKTLSFEEKGKGNYTWVPNGEETLGNVGTTFTLNIDWNGKNYSAISTMAPVPPIDSISQEYRTDEIAGPDGIYAQFFARDLVGLGNTYWIKTYKNNQFLNKPRELNLAAEAGFDSGSVLDGLIFIPPIREGVNRVPDTDAPDDSNVAPWNPGDSLLVEIHSISILAFDFLSIARDQMTNGDNTIFAIPLANTTGNVSSSAAGEDVLGIFNVAAVSSLGKKIE